MNYLRDEIGKVVASLREGFTFDESFDVSFKGQLPAFMYGHRLELNNRLKEKDKKGNAKYRKYPAILLRMDYEEEISGGMITASPGLNLAIVHSTDKNYNAEERDVKIFKPVLFPLYENFMNALRKHGGFSWEGWQGRPPHGKIDRPYYGTETEEQNVKNFFSDPLDAIEITNLKLSLRIKKC